MLAASTFGITSRLAAPFSVLSGIACWRMLSISAASPCISPSISSSGCASCTRASASRILQAPSEFQVPKLELDSRATFGLMPKRRTDCAAISVMAASCCASGFGFT
ncbi:hypothetical protein D3C85_1305700 [compost metagenome]